MASEWSAVAHGIQVAQTTQPPHLQTKRQHPRIDVICLKIHKIVDRVANFIISSPGIPSTTALNKLGT